MCKKGCLHAGMVVVIATAAAAGNAHALTRTACAVDTTHNGSSVATRINLKVLHAQKGERYE